MGLTNDDDPYTGERYLDLDGRRTHRVVKVIEKVQYKVPALEKVYGPRYVVEVMVNDDNPTTVGRKVKISARTLDYRYKHLR